MMARSSILTIEGVARPDPSQWGLGCEKFRSTLGRGLPGWVEVLVGIVELV